MNRRFRDAAAAAAALLSLPLLASLLLMQLSVSHAALNESSLKLQTFPYNGSSSVWSLPLTFSAMPQVATATAAAAAPPPPSSTAAAALLAHSSIIYGLSQVANGSNVNGVCLAQLQHVQRGILGKQPWAMKVLDASGSKTSGFLFGHNYWLGSRQTCQSLRQPMDITLSRNYERVMHYGLVTQTAPFDMDYRVVYVRHSSPWQVEIKLMSEQIIHIGLCLPSACSSDEIKTLTSEYVSGNYMDNDIFELQPEVLYLKDLKLRDSFYERTSFKLVIASVLATCAFMLCAQQLRVAAKSPPADGQHDDLGLAPVESELWRALHTLLKWQPLQNFVSCFDLSNNWRRMCATRECRSSDIPLMNGLRSVCAIWLLVFHVFWFMYFTVHNKTVLLSYAEQAFYQFLATAPILVDVFFTISGFLQTYNFLRNEQQLAAVRQNGLLDNVKLYGKLLFHRYLRLVPLYLMVMGSVDLLFAYMGDTSVYHIHERFDELCGQHWWRNLLFIQNFFGHQEMCLNWSWSLACDMQYFVLANAMLFLYVKHPKLAKGVVISGLIATILWSYGIGLNHRFEFSFDAFYTTGSLIYTSSYVRILPYIVGAIAAWCMLERRLHFELTELQTRALWHFCLLVFFITIHSTVKRDLGPWFSTSLFVLGRICFSLSICWMIVGSAKGSGVWWSRLLEAPLFQHINRLTYAIYLLNPLVISFIFGFTSSSTQTDPFMLFVVNCGFVVIVYIVSILYSLGFEMPYSNLSSLLLRRDIKPKTT